MSTEHIISQQMKRLVQTLNSMDWENPAFYKAWLAQSFYYTTHSTRMLAFAAGWSPSNDHNYFRRSLSHIKEEQSHDLIAIRDLQKLSGSIEDHRELETCRALWEPQFYKIQRNPKYLLGYIFALEQLAVLTFRDLYQRTEKAYGPDSTRFIRVHAEDDPEHVDEAIAQIERCSTIERAEIIKNYDQTCVTYELMLKHIAQSVLG